MVNDEPVTAVVQQVVVDRFERIDLVVNNAGISLTGTRKHRHAGQAVSDINIFCVMRMVKEVLPHI